MRCRGVPSNFDILILIDTSPDFAVIPFPDQTMGRRPAMITGPVLTTITDVTGVIIYLGLSTYFLMHLASGL